MASSPTALRGPQTNPNASGFIAQPGTDFSTGDAAQIAARLDQLAKKLGIRIFGLSGIRTPAHSIEVGGFANDPHTQGKAADIGVNGLTRASASKLTDAQLKSVGLYRPFSGADEINHVQLLPDDQQPTPLLKAAAEAVPGVKQAEDAVSAVKSIGEFLGKLTDPRLWIRVVEVILGGVLVLMGLKSFTGGAVDPLGAAAGAARMVP
jgi:hypothetical protein